MSDYMPKAGEFCWNELMVADTSKAKDFYSGLLGWEANEIDMGDMTYTIFKSGDKDVAGMLQIPQGQEQEIPPHWMSYILVDDLDAMIEKATGLGATVKMPATPVASMGRFTVLLDTTGAHIALWEKAEG